MKHFVTSYFICFTYMYIHIYTYIYHRSYHCRDRDHEIMTMIVTVTVTVRSWSWSRPWSWSWSWSWSWPRPRPWPWSWSWPRPWPLPRGVSLGDSGHKRLETFCIRRRIHLYVCMCICKGMYVFMYGPDVCEDVMFEYMCLSEFVSTCIYVHTHTCVYGRVCLCVLHTDIHTYTHHTHITHAWNILLLMPHAPIGRLHTFSHTIFLQKIDDPNEICFFACTCMYSCMYVCMYSCIFMYVFMHACM